MNVITKRMLLWVLSGLVCTGLLYAVPQGISALIGHEVAIPFGRLALMQVHGALAMLCLVLFGVLWDSHIVKKVKYPKKRRSGIFMALFMGILAITGYLLYYAGDDGVRNVSSVVHTGVGLVFFGVFCWHYSRK